jgi:arylformamidase
MLADIGALQATLRSYQFAKAQRIAQNQLMATPINPTLDVLYNNRAAVPEHGEIFARWRAQSTATRVNFSGEFNLAYDSHPLQTLDIFPVKQNNGLVIFIHGGYWRSLDKDDFSFYAEPYLAEGISVTSINYRLCPEVKVDAIVEDCRAAIEWLAKNVSRYNIRFDRNVLIGHSAGAHLVAIMCATDWTARNVEESNFRGGVLISGLYDLSPLLETSINADIQLTNETAKALSPIHLQPKLNIPLDIVVGGAETSEFIRQSHLLHKTWPANAGSLEIVAGANHFTIVDECAKPDSACFQRSLRFF